MSSPPMCNVVIEAAWHDDPDVNVAAMAAIQEAFLNIADALHDLSDNADVSGSIKEGSAKWPQGEDDDA